ncbi:major facilitator superfamily domain-containing protein [Mrakia frigida]|uniref:major facilitator superfamily domain-containing protein n=1 Tax=Mrakia frigida TaxID=29902 RepID=UPI003FCBF040
MPSNYGLSEVDGKSKQNAFASSSSTPSTEVNSDEHPQPAGKFDDPAWNPALSTPSGVHPLLVDELLPSDNYVDGIYWADLPAGQRTRWAFNQANTESLRELKHVGKMFKKDPLSPINAYFSRYVVGGFGLFTEGSTLFSIGNLTPLFAVAWPQCWSTHQTCDIRWVHSIEYLEIAGIIVGQVLVGFEGDWVGRKFGLVQDALIMFLGLVMLTASWGTTLEGWVICYAWCLFIYGIGVGGEYPMTSTSSLEAKTGVSAEIMSDDRLHRGRNVALAFLMQGWGTLFNQVILIVLLIVFNGGRGNPPYSVKATQWTFRLQFGIVAFMTLWLAYHRYYHGNYVADRKLRADKKKKSVTGYDIKSLKLAFSHFGGRMIGTAGGWFLADVLFYGSKLFQSSFIKVLIPGGGTVMTGWLYNLINIGVSMVGYYIAALTMDHKLWGRKRMQCFGFFMLFLLFAIAGFDYEKLLTPSHIHGFQAIYYLSSFFTQFGPNSTTFLLAAEVYPTSIRSTCHGLSAAAGKFGAMLPAILYAYIDTKTKFLVVTWFALAGLLLTVVFIPDTTGLDLREQERYWQFVRAGKAEEYHGIAVHKRHLSLWETAILKRHLAYDPIKDRAAKLEELSEAYARELQAKLNELPGDEIIEEDGLSPEVSQYFKELEDRKRSLFKEKDIYSAEDIRESENREEFTP